MRAGALWGQPREGSSLRAAPAREQIGARHPANTQRGPARPFPARGGQVPEPQFLSLYRGVWHHPLLGLLGMLARARAPSNGLPELIVVFPP